MTSSTTAPSILDLFARSCAASPDAVALDIPPSAQRTRATVTYRQLNRQADAIARLLLRHKPRSDTVVALALPRTDQRLYAAMLGSMRAGCAYCAIDPIFPARQALQIVQDAGAIALIAEPARATEILGAAPAVMVLTPTMIDAAQRLDACTESFPLIVPSQLAYVIYTSGTTGQPKGVEIEHQSILNLVAGDIEEFGLREGDRVAQGSSASYDSSLEEIWLAWAAGATVVVLDDETARLGPDLLGWLQTERITVLCPPPTLLRTLDCDDPQDALPLIRLLYVGGEALPRDLADLWSRGRRLENGYGPTECTVTCLRATVKEGEEVTIGRAIPGTTAFLIDPDDPQLRVLSAEFDGERRGELVIGGASLARGYRGQPETTRAKFVEHATLGRVYRTGDLVHRDEHGAFHYHGRIDAQVKLRGYRVELGAIEARLAAHESVLEAACAVDGEGSRRRIVAHVVLRPNCTLDIEGLRAFASEQLPHYMVPAAFAALDSVPRTLGGKVDRLRLPTVDAPLAAHGIPHAPAASEMERLVAQALADALGRSEEAVSVEADLFDELGLDSLTVAIAISRLRRTPLSRSATVRLAYQHRTARTIAAAIEQTVVPSVNVAATAPTDSQGDSRPLLATLLQASFLTLLLVSISQLLWLPEVVTNFAQSEAPLHGMPIVTLLWVACAAAIGVGTYALTTLAMALLAKWVLIGRYRTMRVRAWSLFHVRHWMVTRLAALAPWDFIEALGLGPAVLSLFGARIGRRVHIHRGVRLNGGGWDLLTLEDDATVGQDASLRTVQLEAGSLVFGTITVRRGATLETRAGMSPGAELGHGSVLRPLSNLSPSTIVTNTVLDGIPAQPIGTARAVPLVAQPARKSLQVLEVMALALLLLGALLVPLLASFTIFGLHLDGSMYGVLFAGDSLLPMPMGFARIGGAAVCASVLTVLLQAMLVRLLGRAPTHSFSLGSFTAARLSMQSALVDSAGKWLSGTLLWPMWLNAAGARIGSGCEISTITDVIPSTVALGEETFFADGVYLGGPRLHAGTATVERVKLGARCFVGNHAVLPAGVRLPDNTLIGISTRGDGLSAESGLSWFGHPPFQLPRREIVEMERAYTHEPSLIRRLNRWSWELARFALPLGPLFVGLVWFRTMEVAQANSSVLVFRLVALPIGVLAALVTLALSIVLMKWLLLGRVKPGVHALWSCWCSRWDFLYVAWGMWASVPLTFLEGTLLLVVYLRWMGCRIGARALLGSGFSHVVDPDMLHFGDDVTVDALFQAHTFEDRVLKIGHVTLRDGCTIGTNTVLLYGADIGAQATVLPHSVVMKREALLPMSRSQGAPTQSV